MNIIYLVFLLLLSSVLSSPINTPLTNVEENSTEEAAGAETEDSPTTVKTEESKDLNAQETFYPIGGVWWGVRPWGGWGGWGGYRPWHGWHSPHWGGHWGGHGGRPWGGHWGGGKWR